MAYKIYTKSNYFYVVDTEDDKIFEGLAKDVRVRKEFVDSTSFIFENVNGLSTQQTIAFADIQDENGDAYSDLATFVAWYESNTGNFNSGGATPQYYRGYISQFGTSAPILTTFENTLGYEPTTSYGADSSYSINLEDAPFDKIFITTSYYKDSNSLNYEAFLKKEDDNIITISIFPNTGSGDNRLRNFPIEFYIKK